MTDQDIIARKQIETTLKSFSSGSFSKNALALFDALGYNTSRQNPFVHKTTAAFEENFGHAFAERNFNKDKAKFSDWKSVDLLFQLSREELSGQHGLFDSHKINWEGEDEKTVIETYLFFAIELTQSEYSRTLLAQITREVNKIFPMPVMLVFKHGQSLTISIIDRRLHKRDAQKDVLKKVTLIKDIAIASPHRAHIEILFDLSLDELKRVYKFTNFVELHHAWQKTLDTKELNKRFYRELANWYFWAIKNVSFPNDVHDDKDDTVYNSESVIRLLTRLIFIWFIKEKHLIPENIFDERELKNILKSFNAAGSTVYYRAILQNLFFATLNKKIEERKFATDGTFEQNKKNYGIKNLYRYSSDFNISKEAVMKIFVGVSFLNGGLFDCLDFEDEKGKVLYLDGFSRNPKKQAVVPDKLFFAREHTIDLSEVYDDKKKKNEKVKGLFEIFNHYKFTITENTPIEEEVALDPELLGRVFENLLASYNPETQTTARKQTGSFYTPREIVNYMVDESLKAYLKQKLETEAGMKSHDADAGLEILFTYTEKEHAFSGKETKILIDAIDNCKILDPACGSGAFPMGVLHKLVHILHKLDPQNKLWKERQNEKVDHLIKEAEHISDAAIRSKVINDLEESKKDIEESFTNNELDYGRKLYLIENCIYGVDIQPIATQISKLRFFISLVVDQKANKARDNNFGIRPLPNLETKFVAANTLIGLDKPQLLGNSKSSAASQVSIKNPEIEKMEEALKDLRHQYFNARTRTQKRNYQEIDKDLRKKIAELLVKDGWNKDAARSVAAFDPYDQNASSPFFDPEWMFGIEDGFDVVIGNPPYVVDKKLSLEEKKYFEKNFKSAVYQINLYLLFIEKALNLSRRYGNISLIVPNTWLINKTVAGFRKYFIENYEIKSISDLTKVDIFEATVLPIIFFASNKKQDKSHSIRVCEYNEEAFIYKLSVSTSNILSDKDFLINYQLNPEHHLILKKIEQDSKPLHQLAYVSFGVKFYQVNKGVPKQTRYIVDNHTFTHSRKINNNCKRILEGKDIDRYYISFGGKWIEYGEWLAEPRKPELFEGERILLRRIVGQGFLVSCFIDGDFCNNSLLHTVKIFDKTYQTKFVLAILNSRLMGRCFIMRYARDEKTFPEIRIHELESLPIKESVNQSQFTCLVNYILYLKNQNKQSSFFESIIDAMVYEIYFPEEIKAANACVLKHLNNLPELKDDWSDKKKLETIEKVYQELSDEKHHVSIAMARQKTIPEIRIIEGLDK